jgi:hypothetical protein
MAGMGLKGQKNNSDRKFHGGGRRPDHKEVLQREAKERDDFWRKLSPEQQLADLDKRLGEGKGAVKQRLRLHMKISRNRKPDPIIEKVETPHVETDVAIVQKKISKRTKKG